MRKSLVQPDSSRTYLTSVVNRHCGIAPDGTRVEDSAQDLGLENSVEDKLAGLQTSDAGDSTLGPEPSQRAIEEDDTMYATNMHTFACRELTISIDSERAKQRQSLQQQHETSALALSQPNYASWLRI